MGVIACANCLSCKVVPHKPGERPMIRCAADKWGWTENGPKMYPLKTVLRRRLVRCNGYDSMGEHDKADFLVSLGKQIDAMPHSPQGRPSTK